MKKIILLLIVLLASMLFFSCETDYQKPMPENTSPKLMVYDTSDIISNKETRVQWYGNDEDGTKMTYFYCMTTDTALTIDNVASELVDSLWNETENAYVDISMPFANLNADIMYIDSTTYIDTVEVIEVKREIVWSKFFLYGVDEDNGSTNIVSKIFGRTNKIPKHPMVNSKKLDVNGFDSYWFTIGPDSATMVLSKETSFWKPIDFRWMGEDPDGPEVDLEFRWELWALDGAGADIEIIKNSPGWSISYLSVEFSGVIHAYNEAGKYSFRVWARDDAMEESENHATVNFEVFAPQLNRGILYVDDTDDRNYDMTKYLNRGNPDGAEVNTMYEQFLVNAGYQENATNLLKDYDVIEFSLPTGGALYQPSLKILSKYRLVVIATEDRTQSTGIAYASYKKQLIDYMNIGGKVFIIGHSAILLNDLYVNKYEEPRRDVFDNAVLLNSDMCTFFYDYFGIYSYSTGESYAFYSDFLYNAGHPLLPAEYYLKDNFDFVGVTPYQHINASEGIDSLKVDSAQVNKYWKDYAGPGGSTFEFALKENGTVLTGMPVFEAFKGEIVLKYQSIHDLPLEVGSDSSTVDNGGVTHALNWYNPATDQGETENPNGTIIQKSGAIATRYVSDGDVYRTAYIGFPLIFMDNSEGKVSNLFTAMIEWFELENDPFAEDE